MESASFAISAPTGMINPETEKNPVSMLVPGKVKNALRLEGTVLNYQPPNTECFYDVRLCVNGLSGSLWVKFHSISTKPAMILDGGGFYPQTTGISVFRNGQGEIQVNVFDKSNQYRGRAPYDDVFHWQHIAFTWKVSTDTILYLNGCPAGTQPIREPHAPTDNSMNFKIGGNAWGGEAERANITLDHVLMWYDVLTPEEVWQLYVQGGQV